MAKTLSYVYVTDVNTTNSSCLTLSSQIEKQYHCHLEATILTETLSSSCINDNEFICSSSSCSDVLNCTTGAFTVCNNNTDCDNGMGCGYFEEIGTTVCLSTNSAHVNMISYVVFFIMILLSIN